MRKFAVGTQVSGNIIEDLPQQSRDQITGLMAHQMGSAMVKLLKEEGITMVAGLPKIRIMESPDLSYFNVELSCNIPEISHEISDEDFKLLKHIKNCQQGVIKPTVKKDIFKRLEIGDITP